MTIEVPSITCDIIDQHPFCSHLFQFLTFFRNFTRLRIGDLHWRLVSHLAKD